MSWYDRCKKHCKDSHKNAKVIISDKDPHGKKTTHYECKECGHKWRED